MPPFSPAIRQSPLNQVVSWDDLPVNTEHKNQTSKLQAVITANAGSALLEPKTSSDSESAPLIQSDRTDQQRNAQRVSTRQGLTNIHFSNNSFLNFYNLFPISSSPVGTPHNSRPTSTINQTNQAISENEVPLQPTASKPDKVHQLQKILQTVGNTFKFFGAIKAKLSIELKKLEGDPEKSRVHISPSFLNVNRDRLKQVKNRVQAIITTLNGLSAKHPLLMLPAGIALFIIGCVGLVHGEFTGLSVVAVVVGSGMVYYSARSLYQQLKHQNSALKERQGVNYPKRTYSGGGVDIPVTVITQETTPAPIAETPSVRHSGWSAWWKSNETLDALNTSTPRSQTDSRPNSLVIRPVEDQEPTQTRTNHSSWNVDSTFAQNTRSFIDRKLEIVAKLEIERLRQRNNMLDEPWIRPLRIQKAKA
jgi:hypothetical protein